MLGPPGAVRLWFSSISAGNGPNARTVPRTTAAVPSMPATTAVMASGRSAASAVTIKDPDTSTATTRHIATVVVSHCVAQTDGGRAVRQREADHHKATALAILIAKPIANAYWALVIMFTISESKPAQIAGRNH